MLPDVAAYRPNEVLRDRLLTGPPQHRDPSPDSEKHQYTLYLPAVVVQKGRR